MSWYVRACRFPLLGRRSITVKRSEFSILEHILIHGRVPSSIIHDLYRLFVNSKASSSVISNRLAKMKEAEILDRMDIPYTFNGKVLNRSFYCLGERVLKHLRSRKVISDAEFKRGMEIQQEQREPSAPDQTGSLVLHKLLQEVEEQKEVEVFYSRSSQHPLLQKEYRYKEDLLNAGLWPEWIVETDVELIALILVNSQIYNQTTLWELVFVTDFLRMAEEVREDGKEFKVFFSVYDGSDKETIKKSDKDVHQSVMKMKAMLPVPSDWFPHFSVYVLPLKRTVQKLSLLLQYGGFFDGEEEKYFSLRSIFPHLNHHGLSYHFLSGRQEEPNGPLIHERHLLKVNGTKKLIWMYYASEGSVRTYFQLNHLSHYFYDQSFYAEGEKPDELWIVYETEEEANEDSIFLKTSENIWLTSAEKWKKISRNNFQVPSMLQMVSTSFYRRSARKYLKEPLEWIENFSHLYMPINEWKDDFFMEQEYLRILRYMLNGKSVQKVRWIWRPKTETNLLLADAMGEIRISKQVQQVFVIQGSSFEDAVGHTIDLMMKWTINPERFDYLGFNRTSSTKEPLFIVKLYDPGEARELINRASFYSSTMPVLIDAPMEEKKEDEGDFWIPVLPTVYWLQNAKKEKWNKLDMTELILKAIAAEEIN